MILRISWLQFFTQSNPLNNLNITSSIPPILQRQNSAPAPQQQHHPSPSQNQLNGDFYKPNNVNKTVAQSTPASHHPTPSTAGEIHRKYSLPMNTMSTQPMAPQSSFPQMMRKQSAPTIHPIAATQQQQQFLQQSHGSPSRARDRNSFDKVPSNQDVQQLPLLKGGSSNAHFFLPFFLFVFSMREKWLTSSASWHELMLPFFSLFTKCLDFLNNTFYFSIVLFRSWRGRTRGPLH